MKRISAASNSVVNARQELQAPLQNKMTYAYDWSQVALGEGWGEDLNPAYLSAGPVVVLRFYLMLAELF